MYKVLDVREYESIKEYRLSKLGYGTQSIYVDKTQCIVAICENTETGKRSRFEFYPGYQDISLGDIKYYGYKGEYNLIVPGDTIEVVDTDTYKEVRRVKYASKFS